MDQARLREFEYRCIQEEPAECAAACPLHVDARSFVIEVARGAWPEAWKVLRKTLPLPSVLGRICDHPCELRCKRRECGDSIRIGALERACVQTPPPALRVLPLPRRDKRVGVAGSGLSSLTAASDLARKGYPVTVLDSAERVGGLLLEFPEDVLPRDAIDSEVAALRKLGVEFRLETAVDLNMLRRDFDAVYWGLDRGVAEPTLDERGAQGHGAAESSTVKSAADDALHVDPSTMQTTWANVFAGGGLAGDGALSPIGWALDGRRAAVSIDRLLQGATLSAGREKEGPQPTRLFVSLARFDPTPAVVPADARAGYSAAEARQEADRCIRCECLECVKVCEYLKQFGDYPRRHAREIYNNLSFVSGDHKANLLIDSCMLCGLCTAVCPEDFSMPDLCLGARREMVERAKMPPSAHEFALDDYAWSHGDAFALSRSEPGSGTSAYAFFPGCQLAGSNPRQVELVYERLRAHLPGGVGLILDCCGAPPHWAGREDIFAKGLANLTERWEKLGRPTLIFACPTCLALLGPRMEGAKTMFLSRVLETVGIPQATSGDGCRPARALHDPCTTRHNPEVQQSVRRLLAFLGQPVEELALSGEITECCGYGGLEANANPELARRVAARRGGESTNEFVTYCAMCRDSLAAVGTRAIHLLDLIYPGEGDPAGRARPGWSERRENRARLKEQLLSKLWGKGGRAVEPWQAIKLYIPGEVQARLDARRILVEDVQRAVYHAEESGDKLCHRVSGRFLASFRPRAVTFWVEYSPREQDFEIHNAYSHRMTLESGV